MSQTQQNKAMSLEPVKSSNIAKIGYDQESQTLRIEFISGGTYDYANVPQKLYILFKGNKSLGSFFFKYIKDKKEHPFTKIS